MNVVSQFRAAIMNLINPLLIILIVLFLAVLACGEGTTPNTSGGGESGNSNGGSQPQTDSKPVISLQFSEDEFQQVGQEIIPQQNCGGTEPVQNLIERTRSIEHNLEVGAGFEVNSNGQIGFAGTDVELGATVASNLGYTYGVSESVAKSITVSAAAGKDMEHTIKLEEVWTTGTAQVKVGSQEQIIPFSFRKDFRLTLEGSQVVKDCKPEEGQSTLEKLAGSYVLNSWTKAIRPIELEGKVVEGSLTIDTFGIADWKVLLEQAFTNDPGRVEMTARGQVDINTMQIQGIEGGDYNNTHYLDNKWGQTSSEMNLAVRGWNTGSPNDPFTITFDEQSGGKLILQFKNSFGTYVWVKNVP